MKKIVLITILIFAMANTAFAERYGWPFGPGHPLQWGDGYDHGRVAPGGDPIKEMKKGKRNFNAKNKALKKRIKRAKVQKKR